MIGKVKGVAGRNGEGREEMYMYTDVYVHGVCGGPIFRCTERLEKVKIMQRKISHCMVYSGPLGNS